MSNVETRGLCLCKNVKILAPSIRRKVWACHCDMCQRWGGGPLLSVDCGDDVRFEGGEYVAVYDSSVSADRGFCSCCGSHLFYRTKDDNCYFIPAGILDDSEGFELDIQVFTDTKPGYYCFANETREMTSTEFFEGI